MKYIYYIVCLFTFLCSPVYSADFIISDITCPVPQNQRIYNKTGSQCGWCSLETIGYWCGEPKLKGLTNRPECQSYSNPQLVSNVLTKLGVKFEQTQDKVKGRALMRKAMKHGYGCMFGVYRTHAMALLHYDEEGNRVSWTDNSDSSAKTRNSTIKEFESKWDGWVCVVGPDDLSVMRSRQVAVRMWYNKGQ